MPSVTVRFYEELNRFLPPARRKQPFTIEVPEGTTTKALIENLGVPHTEVDLVLVNGESADFSLKLSAGDRVSVYPVFESWDLSGVSRVRAVPLRESRFEADVHLGRLARLLRMMGFDTSYDNDRSDDLIVAAARREQRIVLSRDRGLLKRRAVTHGYLVKSLVPREQLAEVISRFDLARRVRLFTRCLDCNEALVRVSRVSVLDRLPASVAETCSEFSRCPRCGGVFWRGSHWETMRRLAAEVIGRQALS
jgi:uncharacterized protein with PIN domain/sulfur carrier protein ThiS